MERKESGDDENLASAFKGGTTVRATMVGRYDEEGSSDGGGLARASEPETTPSKEAQSKRCLRYTAVSVKRIWPTLGNSCLIPRRQEDLRKQIERAHLHMLRVANVDGVIRIATFDSFAVESVFQVCIRPAHRNSVPPCPDSVCLEATPAQPTLQQPPHHPVSQFQQSPPLPRLLFQTHRHHRRHPNNASHHTSPHN